jgi:hypothetical protein
LRSQRRQAAFAQVLLCIWKHFVFLFLNMMFNVLFKDFNFVLLLSSVGEVAESAMRLFSSAVVRDHLKSRLSKSDRTVRLTTFEVRRIVVISRVAAKLEHSTRRLRGRLTPISGFENANPGLDFRWRLLADTQS